SSDVCSSDLTRGLLRRNGWNGNSGNCELLGPRHGRHREPPGLVQEQAVSRDKDGPRRRWAVVGQGPERVAFDLFFIAMTWCSPRGAHVPEERRGRATP